MKTLVASAHKFSGARATLHYALRDAYDARADAFKALVVITFAFIVLVKICAVSY